MHDCFTLTELLTYEDLGFIEKGAAKEHIAAGTFALGGKLPVNTDGGLKAFGHPTGATGVRMIYENVLQLRGKAGPRQVKDVNTRALAQHRRPSDGVRHRDPGEELMPGQVHFEKKDGVATLTLDNPKARNAFDYEMTQELRRRWAEISRDPEVVCAIVTGAGEKAFCTGWDITSTASGESHKFSQGGRKAAPYSQITALQCRCWKPVITAVNGMCSGGGLHFVADGDIVIASETATFFDTHCEVGLAGRARAGGPRAQDPARRRDAHDAARQRRAHERGARAGDRPDRRGRAAPRS